MNVLQRLALLLMTSILMSCQPTQPTKNTPENHVHGPGESHDHAHGPEPKHKTAKKKQREGNPQDWCAGHGLPESMCTVCNPGLKEAFQGIGDWCEEHGFPESACPTCNPMKAPALANKTTTKTPKTPSGKQRVGDPDDWCVGHKIPESLCTVCNPHLTKKFKDAGDWCEEHGYPESACPKCNPMKPPPRAAFAKGTKIRFRSTSLEQASGIETVPALSADIGLGVDATANIDFNRNAMADVRSAVPGILRKVGVDLGDRVKKGDVIFTLESANVGSLQAQRTSARKRVDVAKSTYTRQAKLNQTGIVSQRQVDSAKQELETAKAELRAIEQTLRISGARRSGRLGRFSVQAPISGSIVRRPALIGTFASKSDSLAMIADTSTMWALLEVPEWDASSVRLGHDVQLKVDGITDKVFKGKITWIASEVNPRTRTVLARTEVSNTDALLRAGQFARAVISVASPQGEVTVPMSAVQRMGESSVVFIKMSPGLYEPRTVRLGRTDGRRIQIAGKVKKGDKVVTTGAFLLRTELTRESIGAGCCEVGKPGGGN